MRTGIGFGSNLGDRQGNLRRARNYLRALPCVQTIRASAPLYETSPVDCGEGTADFLNTVVEVEIGDGTDLSQFLMALRGIETALGRPSRHPKNVSRPVDLDILYAGELTMQTSALTVPHPHLHERRFVLAPLAAIRPELVLPGQQRNVGELLGGLADDATVRLVGHTW